MSRKDKNDFMNPPVEPPSRYEETRNKLLKEFKENQLQGKQKEWYEATLSCWLEMKTKSLRDYWMERAYEERLLEYPVEEYTDSEYVQLVLDLHDSHNAAVFLVWISRNLLKRKLVLERNSPQAEKVLQCGLIRDYLEQEEEKDHYGVYIMMAEVLRLTGSIEENESWSELELNILKLRSIEAVNKCIISGFLVRERVEEYIDFVLEKGEKGLIPILIALKYKED